LIYLKDNTSGVDTQIQLIQKYLYNKLVSMYNCEIHGYGRVYKDGNKSVSKPIAYIGNGRYKELLFDSKIKGLHFFFIVNDESISVKNSNLSNYQVELIIFVNDITKIKQGASHYADEEIKEDIKNIVSPYLRPDTVVKGEKALEGFDISKLQFIYPFFVFKIKSKLNNI